MQEASAAVPQISKHVKTMEEEKVSVFSREAQKKLKSGIDMEQAGTPGEINLLNAKHKF